jgi:hypothetical protein
VDRQRAAVAEVAGDLLPLFDALVEATRALAAGHANARVHATRPLAGAREGQPA